MFALQWEYLTGRAVARAYHGGKIGTDPEWPPHPDRVFQALVAAWGALGEPQAEAAALQWLESLKAPGLYAPDAPEESRSGAETVHVPTNDKTAAGAGFHVRKARTFPSVLLPEGGGTSPSGRSFAACALVWPDATSEDAARFREAFVRLCEAVTHIGHSRSLVRMWVGAEDLPEPNYLPSEDGRGRVFLRIPKEGRFDALCSAYAGGGEAWRRPSAAPYQSYVIPAPQKNGPEYGLFDPRLVILRRVGGNALTLLQTLPFTDALRGTLLKAAEGVGKELISGHPEGDGTPTKRPHVAFVPLPFVGAEYADGHLLGFALAFPRGLSLEEEETIWEAFTRSLDPEKDTLSLVAGAAGACELVPEERPVRPFSLRERTWCDQSAEWASVTPLVLDRLPPRRHQDFDQWAAGQIVEACARQNLPSPARIEVGSVSFVRGVPPARNFPCLKRKDGLRRWHTHARIVFSEPVAGPLLLGAGRFRGYGFFRPVLQWGGNSHDD